jgi:hypothetical protein
MKMNCRSRSLVFVGVIAFFLVLSASAFSTSLDGPLDREISFRQGAGVVERSAHPNADRVGTYLVIAGQLWERTKDPQGVRDLLHIALSELDRTQASGSPQLAPPPAPFAAPPAAPVLPVHVALPTPAADRRPPAAAPDLRVADAPRAPRPMTQVVVASFVIRTRASSPSSSKSPSHTSPADWRGRWNSWRAHLGQVHGLDRPRNLTLLDAPLE